MEYINIKMDVNMKDNFIMIKNMVMVHIYGKMVENMKEIGIKENNKVKEYIMNHLMVKEKKDYGKMVNVLNGQMNDIYIYIIILTNYMLLLIN